MLKLHDMVISVEKKLAGVKNFFAESNKKKNLRWFKATRTDEIVLEDEGPLNRSGQHPVNGRCYCRPATQRFGCYCRPTTQLFGCCYCSPTQRYGR